MMKKLSSSFRRKSSTSTASASPVDVAATPGLDANAGLNQLTNAYQRVLQEQNRQVDELRRLRAMTDQKPPLPKGRSKTFTAGTPTGDENVPSGGEIPFFGSEEKGPAPGVLPVRGRPAWHRGLSNKRRSSKAGKPPRPGKSKPPPPSKSTRRMLTAPSFEPTYQKLDYDLGRTRQLSFSIDDSSRKEPSLDEFSSGSDFSSPPRPDRIAAGRRWKLPKKMNIDTPSSFSKLPGESNEMITQRRDRVEALPLASASTYLESEIFRMKQQLEEHDEQRQCCCRAHSAPLCECGHRMFLTQSIERLRDVLYILEDRYDSIEQYYVKGKEYAHAMGKFYQVSPSEYSRWVEERKPNKGRSRQPTR